eukprot:2478460-Pleurochrysis_carterae.AAC.1
MRAMHPAGEGGVVFRGDGRPQRHSQRRPRRPGGQHVMLAVHLHGFYIAQADQSVLDLDRVAGLEVVRRGG